MKISPSKLQYLSLCPCFEFTESQGPGAADEGTRMHKAVETGDLTSLETEEEKAQVQKVLNLLMVMRADLPADKIEFQELAVKIPGPWGQMRGTLDHAVYVPSTRKAVISDWKMGRLGLPTGAEDSLQLRAYALGFLTRAEQEGWAVDELLVQLVAPRTNDVDTHVYKGSDLQSMIDSIAAVVARAEDSFKKPVSADPEACAHCANSSRCPAMSKSVAVWTPQVAAEYNDLSDVVAPVETMSPGAMARFMAVSSALDEWREQRKKAVLARVLEEGLDVPGYQIVSRAGNTKIEDPASAAQRMLDDGKSLREVLGCATLKISEVRKVWPEMETRLADMLVTGPEIRYLQKSRKKVREALSK